MRVALMALWALAVGCTEPCIRHSDCPNELVCQLGACVMPAIDGDVPEGGVVNLDSDADTDAQMEAMDAGTDASDTGQSIVDASLFPDALLDAPLMDATITDATGTDATGTDAAAGDSAVDASADAADSVDDAGMTDTGDDT